MLPRLPSRISQDLLGRWKFIAPTKQHLMRSVRATGQLVNDVNSYRTDGAVVILCPTLPYCTTVKYTQEVRTLDRLLTSSGS